MRLLVVSNTPFLPPTAGNRERIRRMLEYLRERGWEIGVLLVSDWGVESWDLEGMRRQVDFVELASPPRDPITRARRALRRALDRRPMPAGALLDVDAWCPSWVRARSAALVARWGPDVVLAEYVFLSACLEGLPGGTTRVIDTHDVMHVREHEYASTGMEPRWFCTSLAQERRGLARADLVLAICDDDARTFATMVPERRVLIVPHGEPARPMAPEDAVPGRLLCIASDNDLNVHGLTWFLAEVWPEVRAARRAELVVCGGVCDKLGPAPDGVTLRGFVPALAREYAEARVVLSPVRAGTGLKVKVAEALCHGRPVVATRAGAAGITHQTSGGVIVSDTGRAFAAAVLQLLGDDAGWRRAVEAAGAEAVRRFDPTVAFGPLADRLEAEQATR